MSVKNISVVVASISLMALSSCSSKLISVLVEDTKGNVELVYQGKEAPANLVKEIRFYANGDTLSVTPMKGSAVHGTVVSYHPGNLLKEEVEFVNGKQDGVFRKYDANGVLVFEGSMKNGLKEGVWTAWYDEVQMAEQRTYAKDVLHGKSTYWYIDGELKREERYDSGKLIDAYDLK